MATTTSTGTTTSFSNTPQAGDDLLLAGVTGLTEDSTGVVYLDVMSNDLGGNAKSLWSLDDGTSALTATKVYAPADLLAQDTSRAESTSSDYSAHGAHIWITQDGRVGYDANTYSSDFKSQLQSLGVGEYATDSFTYAIRLGNGTLSWATATVQIAGTNDVVSITSAPQSGGVVEDGTQSTSGTISFTDADLSDGHTATFVPSVTTTTALGVFSLDAMNEAANAANGSVGWHYNLDNSAAQSLAAGETATETYTVTVNDGHGSTTTQDVTVTITGTNDVVSITSAPQSGGVVEDGTQSTSGTISFTDADLSDGHTATVVASSGNTTSFGTFSLDPVNEAANAANGSVGWHYNLDNSAAQSLAAGETATETYTVTVNDGHGSTTAQDVTVTIVGTNDAPVITSGAQSGSVVEDGVLTATGTVAASDADHGAVLTYSGDAITANGAFVVDSSSGVWSYTLANHQNLSATDHLTETFTVTVTDDQNATTQQTVTVNIQGTNDAPMITSGVQSGSVVEDGVLTTTGTVTASDVDHDAVLTYSGNATGSYGSFAVDASGVWTYTLDNAAHQNLAAGESHDESFTVTVTDDQGATVTEAVVITVTGTNDAAVLSSAVSDLTETDLASAISTSGTLTISDVDSPATYVAQADTAGTYGHFSIGTDGAWTYTADSAHNEFAAGTTYTDTFLVASADGTPTSVTINIAGTNDAAVLSSASANLTEVDTAAAISTSGTLTISDVDSAATFVAQAGTAGIYGSFSINSDGAWTYTASSAHDAFVDGQHYIENFDVVSADGTHTSVAIDILGTNDAAVLSSATVDLTETDAALSTSGTLTISDVDSPATYVAQADTAGAYGHFSIATDGAWTYTADSAHNEFAAGNTYTDTFSVVSADGTSTSVTVNIAGTNDAATFTGIDTKGLTETNAAQSTGGTLVASDVDSAAAFVAQADVAGSNGYGHFSVDAAGVWTYTMDTAHNEFAAGTTYTDTLTVATTDGTTHTLTVNMLGTNDAAVLSSATVNLTETNLASDISTNGALTISDVDSSAGFVTQDATAGTYGHFSIGAAGNWTYTADSAHNEFAAGTTYTDTFVVASADGTTTSVTINILGTNDAAVVSGTVTGSVIEAGGISNGTSGTPTASGTLTDTDVDNTSNTFQTVAAGTVSTDGYGSYAMTSGGTWTYTLNNSNATVQALNAGGTLTDHITVNTVDGTSQIVTVTINGANDAATITGTSTGSVIEATSGSAGTPSATGNLDASDVDNPTDSFTVVAAATASANGYGTYTVAANGQWTYSLDNANAAVNALNNGQTLSDSFVVQSIDGTAKTVNVTINGASDAPNAPSITLITDDVVPITDTISSGGSTNDATPTLRVNLSSTGAVEGDTVQIYNGASVVGSAVTLTSTDIAAGFKDITTSALSDGTYSFNAKITDAGNTSAASATYTVTVDTTAPNAPTIISVTDDVLPSIGNVSAGGSTNDTTPTVRVSLTGTNALNNDVVQLYNGATLLGSTTLHGNDLNNGYVDFSLSLTNGTTYNLIAKVTDTVGNTSVASTTYSVTVDTTAPNAPVISAINDDVSPVIGTISSGGSSNDTTPTLSGTAEANSTVTIKDGTTTLGTTTADASGNWSYTTTALAQGSHSFTATATDGAGNVGNASASYTVTVDTTAPNAPVISAINDDVSPVIGTISSGGSSDDTTPTLSGTAEANSTVTIKDGTTILGTTTADASGNWSYTTAALAQGSHSFTVTATDAAGNVSPASSNYTVIVDTVAAAPSAPALTIASDSGQSTSDNTTNDTTPTVTGTGAEAGATVTLYDTNGTTVLGNATADAGGNWTITSSTLSSGAHTLTVKQTDIAGNVSAASASSNVTIDTAAPTTLSWSYASNKVTTTTDASGIWKVVVHDNNTHTDYSATQGNGANSDKWTLSQSGLSGHTLVVTAYDVAGNTTISSHTAPAGVAGEAINLALVDPTPGVADSISYTVNGVPTGWTLSAGTNNGDGSWTITTSDPSALMVTAAPDYVGAMVLTVSYSWINADGTTSSAIVLDNVEAYALGSPIFAWSGDDHLTGSSGADLFVFAQPITNDFIHNFDLAGDKIDLIGFGVASFGDVHMANDAVGNAVITLASGETITVLGVDTASFTADNFVFDQEPVMVNTGTMTISDGAMLPIGGVIENSGIIALGAVNSSSELEILVKSATLEGGGHVVLSDSLSNLIFGGTSDAALINVDNTISGAGNLGGGQMTLVNGGTIIADGSHALDIDTGSNAVVNSGTLEATGSGGLIVHGDLSNTGSLVADDSSLTITGNAVGGSALLLGAGIIEFDLASSVNTTFGVGDGTLILGESSSYTGTVSGFNEGDTLDFRDILSGSDTTLNFTSDADGNGGTLMLSDGTHTASVHMSGDFAAEEFHLMADSSGGTLVSYLPLQNVNP